MRITQASFWNGSRNGYQRITERRLWFGTGAPWHRAKSVQSKAQELSIEIVALPGYSPDLNPIEGLWKWMREDVTQMCCYPSITALFDACKIFIERINKNPIDMVNRLWPRFELDPEVEKL
ncbi:MAG: transposase, partial [bacterium]